MMIKRTKKQTREYHRWLDILTMSERQKAVMERIKAEALKAESAA